MPGDEPVLGRRPVAAARPAVPPRGGVGHLGHPAGGTDRPDGLARTPLRSRRGGAGGLRRAPGGRRRRLHLAGRVATPLVGCDRPVGIAAPCADADRPRRPDYLRALQHALDVLDNHPGHGEAARLAALCFSQLDYGAQAEPYYRIARAAGPMRLEDLHVRALGLRGGTTATRPSPPTGRSSGDGPTIRWPSSGSRPYITRGPSIRRPWRWPAAWRGPPSPSGRWPATP